MKFLELIIKSEHDDSLKPPTIIVDYVKTHTSNLTKEIVSKLIFKTRFLVPYCPAIAPLQQAFGIIRSNRDQMTFKIRSILIKMKESNKF